jgi:hypothetical protein
MKKRFQTRGQIVTNDRFADNIDGIAHSFRNSPTLTLVGQDGKTIFELTKAHIPHVDITMRGPVVCVTGLNDIRQTKNAGWVPFLNGHIPLAPVNECKTRTNDILVWVFMPIRLSDEDTLDGNHENHANSLQST